MLDPRTTPNPSKTSESNLKLTPKPSTNPEKALTENSHLAPRLGRQLLAVAVLCILVTAPPGAALIAALGPRLLEKETKETTMDRRLISWRGGILLALVRVKISCLTFQMESIQHMVDPGFRMILGRSNEMVLLGWFFSGFEFFWPKVLPPWPKARKPWEAEQAKPGRRFHQSQVLYAKDPKGEAFKETPKISGISSASERCDIGCDCQNLQNDWRFHSSKRHSEYLKLLSSSSMIKAITVHQVLRSWMRKFRKRRSQGRAVALKEG